MSASSYRGRGVDAARLLIVHVPSHVRHRQNVVSVRTLASVSTTLPLQNGHMVGRVTVLLNRESSGNDIRIPRARAAFADSFRPTSDGGVTSRTRMPASPETGLFICAQRARCGRGSRSDRPPPRAATAAPASEPAEPSRTMCNSGHRERTGLRETERRGRHVQVDSDNAARLFVRYSRGLGSLRHHCRSTDRSSDAVSRRSHSARQHRARRGSTGICRVGGTMSSFPSAPADAVSPLRVGLPPKVGNPTVPFGTYPRCERGYA